MIKLLVVDGYDPAGLAFLKAAGATQAGVLYKDMLTDLRPHVQIDIAEISHPTPSDIDIAAYDGVCWTGSNLFFSESNHIVQRHIDLCRNFFEAGIPQFGSCWAAQLAAKTAGGDVQLNPKGREFGVARKIVLTEAGRLHPMFKGKTSAFDSFTSHADIVSKLPESASLLAGNAFSAVQAVDVKHANGEFWAVQYHPEYDCAEIAGLAEGRRAALIQQGTFLNEATALEYVIEMRALSADPLRADLAWKYGIDQDLQDADIRTLEVNNWLTYYFDA